MGIRTVLAFASLLGLGCVSAQTFPSGTGKMYPPTQPDTILVFYAAEDVQRPYEVIGEITTSGSSGLGMSEGDLIKKASQEAANLGANAILIRSVDKGTGGDRAMAVLFLTNDKNQHVTAIRFTDEPPSSTP